MPTFCRHNRFVQNCPICSRELAPAPAPAPSEARSRAPATSRARSSGGTRGRTGELRVRQAPRAAEDGYRHALVPGLKSSAAASRLAEEIGFAAGRLLTLAAAPPDLYAELASEPDIEEATWLAFLIAYLSPLPGEDPFAGVRAARVSWSGGALPDLPGVPLGARTAHEAARGTATLTAYRAWAARAGGQAVAFTGEPAWSAERRFSRVFERLALPGLHRAARFELLVTLGCLGRYELRAAELFLGGDDAVSVAAKRVFGIGDKLLLERRAAALAEACEAPLEALDLGLFNWGGEPGERVAPGAPPPALAAELETLAATALGV